MRAARTRTVKLRPKCRGDLPRTCLTGCRFSIMAEGMQRGLRTLGLVFGLLVATGAGAKPKPAPGSTTIVVELGPVNNRTEVKSQQILGMISTESRRRLSGLPNVRVVSHPEPGNRRDAPAVLVTPSIRELKVERQGKQAVYSARVEYMLYAMPDQAIAARIGGSASTSAPLRDARDRVRNAALHREVVEAAVARALERATPALNAAARL